jgi:hypothetical protein
LNKAGSCLLYFYFDRYEVNRFYLIFGIEISIKLFLRRTLRRFVACCANDSKKRNLFLLQIEPPEAHSNNANAHDS